MPYSVLIRNKEYKRECTRERELALPKGEFIAQHNVQQYANICKTLCYMRTLELRNKAQLSSTGQHFVEFIEYREHF